jgi:flagellar basal-body rod protein FlgB
LKTLNAIAPRFGSLAPASGKIAGVGSSEKMPELEVSVGPVYLFDLASRQSQWLAVRQATIAGNISNANTSGYKALDVEPFTSVLDKTQLAMTGTDQGHMGLDAPHVRSAKVKKTDSREIMHSGNSVSLEQELEKAGTVNREHSLNTSIVKAFHRMIMASTRSGG